MPPDQRAVRNQGNYAFGAGTRHLVRSGPKEHNDHAYTGDQEWEITIIYPCSQFGQITLAFVERFAAKTRSSFPALVPCSDRTRLMIASP